MGLLHVLRKHAADVLIAIVVVSIAIMLSGAGTTTITDMTGGYYQEIVFDVVADSNGTVDTTTANMTTQFSRGAYWGYLEQVQIVPGSGTSAPDSFSVAIYDRNGQDILQGSLFDADDSTAVDSANATILTDTADDIGYVLVGDTLHLYCVGLDSAKAATITLRIRTQ